MAISTYAELKQAIQNWAKRSDISSVIDDFIDLAEADIWQRLQIREMEHRTTLNSSITTRYVALPSDFLHARRLKIDRSASNLSDVVLEYAAPMALRVVENEGMPLTFTITSQIELDRVSDQVYTLDLQYVRSLTPLSASATSNAVLTRFPMVYLYAALFHFGNWSQDDAITQKYATLAEGAINSANALDRRGRYGPAPGVRMLGATP